MVGKMLSFSRKVLNFEALRKCLVNLERATCSGRYPQLPSQSTIQKATNDEPSKGGYGEKEIFLLGPTDIRTPLPGNMGIPPLSVLCIDVLSSYPLECIGYDCPQLLRKDFSDLFPNRDLDAGILTVITLCQRTKNDMSEWSENAEIERASLQSSFVTAATGICSQLKCHSYWADFIHPNSGKPNFDSLKSATMFETDVRYRHFGFTIEDLGCCRIVLHKEWGTHVFIGAIFTNAPLHSKEVQSVLDHHKSIQDVWKRL